jgi:V/A-type H+-transporting ATPase subunit G/H
LWLVVQMKTSIYRVSPVLDSIMTAAQRERVLRNIKDAEEEAEDIVAEAEEEAEEIRAKARREADEIVTEAEQEAQETREEILEEARDEIESDKQEILDEGKEEVEKLRQRAEQNHDDALAYVVERFREEVDAET